MVLSDKIAIMSEGKLQQYSTPQETYNRPANRFVAGFIGSPRMNFFEGELSVEDETAMLRGRASFPVPGEQIRQMAGKQGGRIIAGVRPEHILLSPHVNGGTEGVVHLLEPIGPVTYVDFTVGDISLRASVPASTVLSPGQPVGVTFESDQFHIFDKENGNRIDVA